MAQLQELILTVLFDCRLSAQYKHHTEGHPWSLCPEGQGLDVRGSPGFHSEAAGLLPKTEQAGPSWLRMCSGPLGSVHTRGPSGQA